MPRILALFTGPWTDVPLEAVAAKASEWGYQAIHALHHHKTDLTLLDAEGMSPFYVAKAYGRIEVLSALKKCGVTA